MKKKTRFTGVYSYESTQRRHNGRSDVCFYITFREHGKKVWEKIGWKSDGHTAAEAKQVRNRRMRSIGKHSPAPHLQWIDAWEKFDRLHLSTLKLPELDRGRHANHIKPLFNGKTLQEITPLVIQDLRKELLKKNLSASTMRHVLGLVRRVFNRCRDWGLWQGPAPTDNMDMPKADNSRLRYLTADEAKKLLARLKRRSKQTWAMTLMSLTTGMRFSEIATLRSERINMTRRTIDLTDTKNTTGRTTYITDELHDALKEFDTTPGHLLFPGRNGKPMKKISSAFPRAVKNLDLNKGHADSRDKVVFHTLRHTYASWLAIAGTPIYVISQMLGHKSLEMTQRYAKLSPDARQGTTTAISNMLSHQS